MGYQLIETVTVGSGGVASIEFTSIPQDGVDLLLVVSGRFNTGASRSFGLTLNSESINQTSIEMTGTGSAVSSSAPTTLASLSTSGGDTASTFGNSSIYISNYASAANKSLSFDAVTENNATAAFQQIRAGLWSNTSAITSIQLNAPSTRFFVEHSTASLYKITAD